MKPLKNLEDSLQMLIFDADAVILDGKQPVPLLQLGIDTHPGTCFASIFETIADQILKDADQLRDISHDFGQRVVEPRQADSVRFSVARSPRLP